MRAFRSGRRFAARRAVGVRDADLVAAAHDVFAVILVDAFGHAAAHRRAVVPVHAGVAAAHGVALADAGAIAAVAGRAAVVRRVHALAVAGARRARGAAAHRLAGVRA